MIHDLIKALRNEIKNIIYKSWFHFIRYTGLLLIPLIYGFSYIFAFYDPFPNINRLQISVVTETEAEDPFGFHLGEALKQAHVKIGETHMQLSMDHIYVDQNAADQLNEEQKIAKIKTDSYATFELRGMERGALTKAVVGALPKTSNSFGIDFQTIMNAVTSAKTASKVDISFSPNFKKNYLIAFGVNIGSAMQGTYVMAAREALETLKDKDFQDTIDADAKTNNYFGGKDVDWGAVDSFVTNMESKIGSSTNSLNPVTLKTNFGEEQHNKYGYGLAPFFICVAMWVGGMVMTFAVHRKIYDKNVTPGHRYFAKWLIIIWGTIIQASILMGALYLIGFKDLGIDHWGSMYGFTIFIGIVFASLIQAIRFTIHSRNLGIFAIIILLVLQMTSGGGLFPIETQSSFYKVLNVILPMSKGIAIIRETAFETNWSTLFTQLGYLCIYLLIIPFAVAANHWRTVMIYLDNDFPLPEKTKQWLGYREYKKSLKVQGKSSRKGGA